jgi:hypothetical protein
MLRRQQLHVKVGFCWADTAVGAEGIHMKYVENLSSYVLLYLPKLHKKNTQPQ